MISKRRTVFLFICVVCAYIVWGALISIPPTFYPTEAEKKGAAPAQVNDSCIQARGICGGNMTLGWILSI